jgi:hypothetical protein
MANLVNKQYIQDPFNFKSMFGQKVASNSLFSYFFTNLLIIHSAMFGVHEVSRRLLYKVKTLMKNFHKRW